eukprot:gb/GEZJ01002408.1/.p1 GENE.gb/GEZJ01002408.1/~~gb/GEZJ01002408.1/.p1  ORF type:complete len:508 (-),score=28.28 gb/GEZJ01002408.1/:1146-2669(-)
MPTLHSPSPSASTTFLSDHSRFFPVAPRRFRCFPHRFSPPSLRAMALERLAALAPIFLALFYVALALPVQPIAVPVFTSHDTPSMRPFARSGSHAPNPTTVTSCGQWISIYERHWQEYPHCHQGKTNPLCCELYDLMDKSIRIFKHQLKCQVSNMAFYQKKFSAYCVNGGSTSTHTSTSVGTVVTTSSSAETTSINIRPPVADHGSHGTGKITILEEEISTHTGQVCTSGNCCTGQSCYCQQCAETTTTTTTSCTSTSCGCTGQHCTTPCQGVHCSTPCTGTHCTTGCTGTDCNTAVAQQPQQPAQPDSTNTNTFVCQEGVTCNGVCINNRCVGVAQAQSNDDDDNVCFHPQTTVELASGKIKSMHELNVDDHVHVGFGKYSRVFMFTHNDVSIPATFMNVTVQSGESIMLTPSHFIYLRHGLMQASRIKRGTLIQMHDGRYESVVNAMRVKSFGLFNPQTMHGDIAVSGFRASTYTTAIPSGTAHALLAPLRALYRICGAHISSVF